MKRFIALWLILLALSWYPVDAARTFVASSTGLTLAALVVTAPFSVCAWFKSNSTSFDEAIWSLGHTSTAASYHRLGLFSTNDTVEMASRNSGTAKASSVGTYTAGAWYHACGGVNSGSTSRWVALNGATIVTTTATQVPAIDQTAIGRRAVPTADEYFRGELEHVAVWNIETLTQGEVTAMSAGINPVCIRPQNLVSYVPIWGDSSPEIDLAGPRAWTIVGSPAKTTLGAPVSRASGCTVGR